MTAPAPERLPGVDAQHETAAFWVAREKDPEAVLLTAGGIEDHNRALATPGSTSAWFDPLGGRGAATLSTEIGERLAFLRERVRSGAYVDERGRGFAGRLDAALKPISLATDPPTDVRIVLRPTRVRCGPFRDGLFKSPKTGETIDPSFDRNNCSTLRSQELVQVVRAPSAGRGMLLVRGGYTFGWVSEADSLSKPLTDAEQRSLRDAPRLRSTRALQLSSSSETVAVPAHTTLRQTSRGAKTVWFAGKQGLQQSHPLDEASVVEARRDLTRGALLETAFSFVGTPYGWGGQGQGRDCSRFLMDVFASFGLDLPRHSASQAASGSMAVDVPKGVGRQERYSLIDEAHQRGVALLHFPGHIMLYLGRNEAGVPMALHAFAEYLDPCAGGGETLRRVKTIRVSDLTLGQGTSRTAFIDRITKITMLAQTPGPALLGAVTRRRSAPSRIADDGACKSSTGVLAMASPRHVHRGATARFIAVADHDLGSVHWHLTGPEGASHRLSPTVTGGAPFGYWSHIAAEKLAAGKWTARLGEDERVEACVDFEVKEKGPYRQAGAGAVWGARRAWSRKWENLYSMFIEQLFDYPTNDDRTWTNLQQLLGNQQNNILFDHLGQGEDDRLSLRPDCADLPYFLRAYFAWKMRLPFAFRRCNRGIRGKAPYCDRKLFSQLEEREHPDEVKAFSTFARRNIADGVHSGSGRTGPRDEATDYYPVALTRESLRPGTVFADPYGHILIVADWVPQGVGTYGVLVGADAQPDGTIGRRRFWQGSFLFKPETKQAGAGFKAFRPVRYRGGRVRVLGNEALASSTVFSPWSMEQYEGTELRFYEKVQGLINPRPLDPSGVLQSLVDALHESVKRRVVSVENGVAFKKKKRSTIKMPRGHAIFETTGAWENYSTPSRDMRLLISIDTVTGFIGSAKRQPERYSLPLDERKRDLAVSRLREELAELLASRQVVYRGSDGTERTLSLSDIVKRQQGLEMAYNPNDCIEIRWAEAKDSEAMKACKRRAPSFQQRRMARYRDWFRERRRPPR